MKKFFEAIKSWVEEFNLRFLLVVFFAIVVFVGVIVGYVIVATKAPVETEILVNYRYHDGIKVSSCIDNQPEICAGKMVTVELPEGQNERFWLNGWGYDEKPLMSEKLYQGQNEVYVPKDIQELRIQVQPATLLEEQKLSDAANLVMTPRHGGMLIMIRPGEVVVLDDEEIVIQYSDFFDQIEVFWREGWYMGDDINERTDFWSENYSVHVVSSQGLIEVVKHTQLDDINIMAVEE